MKWNKMKNLFFFLKRNETKRKLNILKNRKSNGKIEIELKYQHQHQHTYIIILNR